MFNSGSSVCIPTSAEMMQRLRMGRRPTERSGGLQEGPVFASLPRQFLTHISQPLRNEHLSVDNMAITDLWKRLSPAALNFWIQTFSLIAIFFEGVSGILSSGR